MHQLLTNTVSWGYSHRRVILLKLVVGVLLAYNHYYPSNSHFALLTNLVWLLAF